MVEGVSCYTSFGMINLDTWIQGRFRSEDAGNACLGFTGWKNGTQKGLFDHISSFDQIFDNDFFPELWEKETWEKHLDALEPSGKVSGKLFMDIGGLMLDATAKFNKTTFEKIWKKKDFYITDSWKSEIDPEIDVKLGDARVKIHVGGSFNFSDKEVLGQTQACFDDNCKQVSEWWMLWNNQTTRKETQQTLKASKEVKITLSNNRNTVIHAIVEGNLKAEIDQIFTKAIGIQVKVSLMIVGDWPDHTVNGEVDMTIQGLSRVSEDSQQGLSNVSAVSALNGALSLFFDPNEYIS